MDESNLEDRVIQFAIVNHTKYHSKIRNWNRDALKVKVKVAFLLKTSHTLKVLPSTFIVEPRISINQTF